MSNSTPTGWSTGVETRDSYLRRIGELLLKGVSVGVLAGIGAFVYNATQFISVSVDGPILLVPVVAAGAFAHLFAATLRKSIQIGLVGFFVGLLTLLLAWVSPIWILSYSPDAWGYMLTKLAREAMTAAFITYVMTYFGGYLFTVSVAAFWE